MTRPKKPLRHTMRNPSIAGYSKGSWRVLMWLLSIIILSAGAYWAGVNNLPDNYPLLSSDKLILQQQFEQQQQIAETLRNNLREQKLINTQARETINLLKDQITQLHQQETALRDRLVLYKQMIGNAAEQRQPITIHTVELYPAHDNKTFRCIVVLQQGIGRNHKIAPSNGFVEITAVGNDTRQQQNRHELDYNDTHQQNKVHGAGVAVQVVIFRRIEGTFVLPEGFYPEHLEIRVCNRRCNKKAKVSQYAWSPGGLVDAI